jgi:hypothetical protein
MKDNIRNVVTGRVEPCKLVVNSKAYSPKWPVGNILYSRGKTGREFFYMLNSGIVTNERKIVKNKLIVKRIEINNRGQKNQTGKVEGGQSTPVLR